MSTRYAYSFDREDNYQAEYDTEQEAIEAALDDAEDTYGELTCKLDNITIYIGKITNYKCDIRNSDLNLKDTILKDLEHQGFGEEIHEWINSLSGEDYNTIAETINRAIDITLESIEKKPNFFSVYDIKEYSYNDQV